MEMRNEIKDALKVTTDANAAIEERFRIWQVEMTAEVTAFQQFFEKLSSSLAKGFFGILTTLYSIIFLIIFVR